MSEWWIGCSGFHYKNWKDRFYPPKLPSTKWFEYYCQSFNTVELNVSFYRYPTLKALNGWYDRSPERFRFSMKAPRLITHFKKFHQVKRETDDFYLLAREGLREKLGPILFQLPPAMAYSEESLGRIIETVDPSFVNAVEFRNVSWWNEKVKEELRRRNITFCGISYPSLPDDVIKTSKTMYYRFHGVPQLYKSSYSNEKLESVRNGIISHAGASDIYAYFNNDIDVAAIDNANTLKALAMTDGLNTV
jgi:uncharacterized protein YecE (DUF72 family)